jgi:hypothetical protein
MHTHQDFSRIMDQVAGNKTASRDISASRKVEAGIYGYNKIQYKSCDSTRIGPQRNQSRYCRTFLVSFRQSPSNFGRTTLIHTGDAIPLITGNLPGIGLVQSLIRIVCFKIGRCSKYLDHGFSNRRGFSFQPHQSPSYIAGMARLPIISRSFSRLAGEQSVCSSVFFQGHVIDHLLIVQAG